MTKPLHQPHLTSLADVLKEMREFRKLHPPPPPPPPKKGKK